MRVGFAWAGSLDPDVIEATLADARDNARFATPDPDLVLRPAPTASPPSSSTCGTTASPPRRSRRRSTWPCSSTAPPAPTAHASARSPRPITPTVAPRWRSPRPPASRRTEKAYVRPSSPWTPSRGRAPTPRPAPASASDVAPVGFIADEAMDDAVPAGDTDAAGSQKGTSRVATRWSSIPTASYSTLLGVVSSGLLGRGGREEQVVVCRPHRRFDRGSHRDVGRADPAAPVRSAPPRTTARGWPAAATSSFPTACCACSSTTPWRPAGRAPLQPDRRCGAA